LRIHVGEGITGRCAELGESIVVADAANCEFGRQIEGTPSIEESLLAVHMRYGARVVGVVVVSKLGLNQFDEDDVRLLEILAGHAAVAVENASLYESARREAESATALLEFGRELATATSLDDIFDRVVTLTATMLGSAKTSVWTEDDHAWLVVRKLHGHADDERATVVARQYRLTPALRRLGESPEPFVLGPEEYARLDMESPDPGASYAVAPL